MANPAAKAIYLLRSGRSLPHRVRNKVDGWIDRLSARCALNGVRSENELNQGLLELGLQAEYAEDASLVSLEAHLRSRMAQLAGAPAPFGAFHNGTAALGRICYAACRSLRPSAIVETGVAYGVTTAYILQALAENAEGELYSVDLPPLGPRAADYLGFMVPQDLRKRWHLRIGSARKALPEVLREIGGADIFVHDSLHTYAHMRMEFAAAFAALRPGGLLIADDVGGNRAFEEAVCSSRVTSWFAIKEGEKDAICGAMRIGPP